jgi:hypothetical protein
MAFGTPYQDTTTPLRTEIVFSPQIDRRRPAQSLYLDHPLPGSRERPVDVTLGQLQIMGGDGVRSP